MEMFILIAAGYLMRRGNLVSGKTVGELSNVLLSVILPCSIISSGFGECSPQMVNNAAFSFVIISLYYILAFLVSLLLFRKKAAERGERAISVNSAVFANTSFIGYPLSEVLFGSEGVIYAVVYNFVYNIFMFTLGVRLYAGEREKGRGMLRQMLLDPLTLSSVLSLLLFLLPWKLPPVIQNSVTALGNVSMPLSMALVGSWLIGVDFRRVFGRFSSYPVVALRLVVFPVIMHILLLPSGLDRILTGTIVLLTSLPVGTLNVILAEKYSLDRDYAGDTMMLSLAFSLITIPFITLLIT